ncbi:MAG: hypothetical protein V7644_29, partial [Actinomycetota bacterium]
AVAAAARAAARIRFATGGAEAVA